MQTFAKVVSGHVVDQVVAAVAPSDGIWLPVVVEMPTYDAARFREVERANRIEADRVVRTVTLEQIPVLPHDIKLEAQRRIIELVGAGDMTNCLVRQLNAQMRASELINKRAIGQTLTETEEAEAAALQALAAAIKAIRARSDALELTLPADYTSNAHWA